MTKMKVKAKDRNSMSLTSVFGPHKLKQGLGGSDDSLIIITASITCPVLLWLSARHANPVPTFRCSLRRDEENSLILTHMEILGPHLT